MVRREDFGEQFPTDSDDVPPVSPLDNFAEADYDVRGPAGGSAESVGLKDFAPNPEIPDPEPPKRDSYAGIILAFANAKDQYPRYYWVLRQDGATGSARSLSPSEFTDLRPGDDVVMVEDNVANHYIIVGRGTPDERALAHVELDAELTTTTAKTLELKDTIQVAPIDNTFGGYADLEVYADGTIKCNRGGVYEIHATVMVGIGGDFVGQGSIDLCTGCRPSSAVALGTSVNRTPLIEFNQQNGFRHHRKEDGASFVELYGQVQDSILNQQDLDTDPFWTQDAKIGGNLHVASQVDWAWLRVKDFYLTQHPDDSFLKWIVPRSPPSDPCDFLVANGMYGDYCVQLDWFSPGLYGTVTLDGYTFTFSRGLLTDSNHPNLSEHYCSYTTPYCASVDGSHYDPCNQHY